MTDWPIDHVDSHVDDALARFTYEYSDKPLVQGVARVWAERMQALEDSAYDLLVMRWLDDAEGEQLDRIGETVGEGRLARSDADYRVATKIRIGLNQGAGQAPIVIFVINELLETGVYASDFPAVITITTDNEPINLEQQRGIVSVLPAGVGVTSYNALQNSQVPSYGIGQLSATDTEIVPYVVEQISDALWVGPATAPIAGVVGGVIPELPESPIIRRAAANRSIASVATTVTEVRPPEPVGLLSQSSRVTRAVAHRSATTTRIQPAPPVTLVSQSTRQSYAAWASTQSTVTVTPSVY